MNLIRYAHPSVMRQSYCRDMTHTFIFKEALAFEDLMKRMSELQERFHNMK